jgi:hypothetical protein
MKTTIIKLIMFAFILSVFSACKKEVYPEELKFLVVDSLTKKPIPNATIQLIKVWRHPIKIGDNSQSGDWFPSYGRKQIQEIQSGTTDSKGRLTLTQEHKKYLSIVPGAMAEGYQMHRLDTLETFSKEKAKQAVYRIALMPLIKTSFIFKSHVPGFETDSVVFSSSNKVKVMRGAMINDRLEVYTSNNIYPYSKVWYAGTIYRNGKKLSICNYVVAYPQDNNEFDINIDIE